jgi:hypothetical protein
VSYQSRLNERGDEVGVTAFAAFRACDMRSRSNSCERPNCSSNLTRISTFNLIFVSKLVKRCYLSFKRNSQKTKKLIFLAISNRWILHCWIPLFNAHLLSRKNFTSFFSFKRNSQKNKKPIFLDIFGSHANKWGLWPELSLCPNSASYTITHRNFVRIGDKIFFRKNLLSNLHIEKTFKRS